MKPLPQSKRSADGNALMITMIMTAVSLITLAGILSWSSGNARLANRSSQYTRSVAAAEAATEKAASTLVSDFLSGGDGMVAYNFNTYGRAVPTTADSSYWSDWQFSDGQGQFGKTLVKLMGSTNYTVTNGAYSGLNGFASTYHVVSNARMTDSLQNVTAGVLQELQLTRIPIFQFAMYSSGEMEISCGAPFVISGPVHCNGELYIEPDNLMTFQSGVTAVGDLLFQRDPLDTRGPPSGAATYNVPWKSNTPALTLPIGASNTPTAVREIIEPPPSYENPLSAMGRQRYYNQADMVLLVLDSGFLGISSGLSSFGFTVPSLQIQSFVTVTNRFYDSREGKTVAPVDINIGALVAWSASNTILRPMLGRDLDSIYVVDLRGNLPANTLTAVRVYNGRKLPPLGLTVATGRPLYVWGHYNQTNDGSLGTADTTTTVPASLVADAVTILSPAWVDSLSTASLSSRNAADTTVNAAILAGSVDTTAGNYSGGMENFPRFLEYWNTTFTYNGSMVKMFPSLYATNVWGKANVYDPPSRNWTYDTNFTNPLRLPPLTPSLQTVTRSQWTTLAPNQITASTGP